MKDVNVLQKINLFQLPGRYIMYTFWLPWPEMLVLASAGEEYFDFIFNILQFHVENLQGKNRTVLVLVWVSLVMRREIKEKRVKQVSGGRHEPLTSRLSAAGRAVSRWGPVIGETWTKIHKLPIEAATNFKMASSRGSKAKTIKQLTESICACSDSALVTIIYALTSYLPSTNSKWRIVIWAVKGRQY